jgi:ATP-dependent protease ClpP protease subunit
MDLIRDLADVNGPVDVHINSPGGEVFEGITIYNALMQRQNVTVYIDGLAASIASVIAMAGSPVLMARQGSLMIHEGYAAAIGSAQDMRDLAANLERQSNNIAQIYSEHSGKPVAYWRELMKAETWMNADTAISEGLVDRLIDSGAGRPVPDNNWDMSVFNAASVPYVGEKQPRHEPMTGKHRHDHAAYEAGDHDDGMHYHMHTHSNDADHHHTHTPGEGHETGGVGPAHVGESILSDEFITHIFAMEATLINWDAAAAFAKCNSASDYRSICAGEHTGGDPNSAAHWALPHHNSPGAGPDRGGVVAALGRLNQTDNLKSKSAAASHLHGHARALGLPSGDDYTEFTPGDADIARFTNSIKALRGA